MYPIVNYHQKTSLAFYRTNLEIIGLSLMICHSFGFRFKNTKVDQAAGSVMTLS